MSAYKTVEPYMELFRIYAQCDEKALYAEHLTRCLMQGVVYRDHTAFAFGEFLENDPGHFFIYGWAGKGSIHRLLKQYEASGGPPIEKVSWNRRRAGGHDIPSGPYDYQKLRRVIAWDRQK